MLRQNKKLLVSQEKLAITVFSLKRLVLVLYVEQFVILKFVSLTLRFLLH